jgi:hypothetical protein
MKELHIGFTGTQAGMTPWQKARLALHIRHLLGLGAEQVYFHHGLCIGADAEAHAIFRELCPGGRVIGHPPENTSKMAKFDPGDFYEMRAPKPYLDRNRDIVDETTHLIGTPKEDGPVLRSGTWSTIRYAKKMSGEARGLVVIHPNHGVQP